jgi:hypothetical protein
MTINGEKFEYPDAIGTILISANDYMDLDLPVAYLSVIYRQPPTYEQYQLMSDVVTKFNGHMEPYRTGANNINMGNILTLVYIIAICAALALIRYLIAFLLSACEVVWRNLFIIGCRPIKIFGYIVAQFTLIYTFAVIIAFYPCRAIIDWLTELGISVEIAMNTQVLLSMGCILLLLIASLPTIISALRKYTREDGQYIAAY